jgi:hypothetical protein
MTIQIIRAALESKLASITPVIATAFENGTFKPVSGVPYQRSNLLPNTPEDSQIGSRSFFERGIYQVTLCYPLGAGTAACETRAQLVKDAFKRGTSIVQSGVTVITMNVPSVTSAMIDGDRYCLPISIRYQAQLST